MLSVVIATKDRPNALKMLSLPSLLRQESGDFEVIIWDASSNSESREIYGTFTESFKTLGADLRYFKAPRVGLTAQRNDSIPHTRGDSILFIDDDCEISSDGVTTLIRYFKSFPWLMGAALPLINKPENKPFINKTSILSFALTIFWMKNNDFKRKIASSSTSSTPTIDLPGTAEWLSGGSMAYRKEVFDTLAFDERLQRFGGYSLGEDYDFSHRVALCFNAPLLVTNGGYMVHHPASGSRHANSVQRIASFYYNMALIRRNFNYYRKGYYGLLPFLWAQLGTTLAFLTTGTPIHTLIKGIKEARRALNEESAFKHVSPLKR